MLVFLALCSLILQSVCKRRQMISACDHQQRAVYKFQYNLCDALFVGYTRRHLNKRSVPRSKVY